MFKGISTFIKSSYKFSHCMKQNISFAILYKASTLDKIILVIISQYLLFIFMVLILLLLFTFCKSIIIFLKFLSFSIFSIFDKNIFNIFLMLSSIISLYIVYISFINSCMNSKLLYGFI